MRRRRRRQRFAARYGKTLTMLLIVVCAAVFFFNSARLLGYGLDALRARRASKALQALYHEADAQPMPTEEPPLALTPEPRLLAAERTPPPEAAPTASGPSPVPAGVYPDNPYHRKSSVILRLQRQNPDIVGWLSIDGVLDEAVVQRDNSYYLKRDYKGYHNANGALFLDALCDLGARQPLYMIYGHNMKTEAMFGCLHKWEKTSWYHEHPIVHLTMLYEEGDYVVFSAGVMTTSGLASALSLYLQEESPEREERLLALIHSLERASLYTNQLDVTPEDQLLLLVTCTGDDSERRVLAARKLRAGENAENAARRVRQNWRK